MIIVLHEAVSLKRYLEEYGDKSPEWYQACANCDWPKLRKHGRFFRSVVLGLVFERVPVYRRWCPNCNKTFSLLPVFIRPYAHFGVSVREATARTIAAGSTINNLVRRFCRNAGGISRRTISRWLQHWRLRITLVICLIERILLHAPGFDATPYLPRQSEPLGWLKSILALSKVLRDLVYQSGTAIPVMMFLNSLYPASMSL